MANNNEETHFKVDLFQVSQGGKCFFVGIIPAKFFIDVYTIDPVVYDFQKEVALKETSPDMSDYFERSIAEKQKTMDSKGFQRTHDPKREKQIIKFLKEDDYPFFPNSIIATLDIGDHMKFECNVDDQTLQRSIAKNSSFAILVEVDNRFQIFIPRRKSSILIIDGQHRLVGLKGAGEVKEDYDLIVSLLLDYDRSVIAKQFYTINYEQKSVNKSLLYHLTGEFSQDLDEITFLHEVIKLLNENDNSPFFNRIKMLGTAPKYGSIEENKKLTLSQAFLIDYLIYSIKDRKAKSVIQPIFKYYFDNDKYEVVRFLISYFTAIEKILPEWNEPDKSILSKTMGVGALLKILNYLFLKIFYEKGLDHEPKGINGLKSDYFIKKLRGIENVDFALFSGGSSAGTVNQLKIMMIQSIKYFKCDEYTDYMDFENNFKKDYSLKFQNWLQSK